jgi:hypothetical protein
MQAVLLWISLAVLTLVTGGMAAVQHVRETECTFSTLLKEPFGAKVLIIVRAVLSAALFLFVSFLTPPAPICLVPWCDIPGNAAWVSALLIGTVFTLFALVFPPSEHKSGLREPFAGSTNA